MSYVLKSNFKMFSLNSNRELAEEMASLLGCELGKCSVKQFSDGEIQISIDESVRGCEVYIVQSASDPNKHMMELLIMIDALKRASAQMINVVMPYYSYARQDRKARSREPITARLMANLLETAGASRLLTIDFHSPQVQGFFDIPVEHLVGIPILADYFKEKALEDLVVVAPHNGGVVRARKLAGLLNAPIALIDRRRAEHSVTEIMNIIGNIEGKNAIIIDDLIDTGSTIATCVNALIDNGAKAVYAGCTHPVLSGEAVRRIQSTPIKELVVTNTIALPAEKKMEQITVLSVAPLLVEAIDRIHNLKAVSPLFE